jgi:hypothetical protein
VVVRVAQDRQQWDRQRTADRVVGPSATHVRLRRWSPRRVTPLERSFSCARCPATPSDGSSGSWKKAAMYRAT